MVEPRILHQTPPMWEQINAVFNVAGKDVCFAWGDTIYIPTGFKMPEELMAHEKVHLKRQKEFDQIGAGLDLELRVSAWWMEYISDPAFRLREEIPAHIAEYQELLRINGNNRANRRRFARYVGNRLASPLYGSLIKSSHAKKCLEECLRG